MELAAQHIRYRCLTGYAAALTGRLPRYERRSPLITANQPFGDWSRVFPAMTLAAVDRLVHHSTIFEMNVESY